MSRRTNYHYDDVEDDDEEITELHSKVKLLKNISIQIGEETREHNQFLKQLDSRAESVFGALSANMDKVKRFAKSGHNRIVFYLLAFALFVMIIIYFISRN